ncbi:hypothetical protein [Psychromonas antarctica]|uniref:hypothetical protein n=1 Tax=Psychromonas antarctica TaxID=67573 RepID=UPI001EE96DA8|nr:hypothetical protein [Psychromonas antarctica]MCG6202323.1 hypothetical protein [Psychromonas antarctica]
MDYILDKAQKKNLKLKLHPLLKSAYTLCLSLPIKFNLNVFSGTSQQLISSSLPIYLYQKNKSLYLISGFENTGFDINETNHSKRTVVVLKGRTDDEILEFCWGNIFNKLLSSIDSKQFGKLYPLFKDCLPTKITRKLVGKDKISEQQLSDLTSVSRSTIARQRAELSDNTKVKSKPEQTILERSLQLMSEANDEHG